MSNLSQGQQIALFAVLAAIWAVWIILACYQGPHHDISALFVAGWFSGAGQPELIYLAPSQVYNHEVVPEWRALMIAQGLPDQLVSAYIYPPIWAALLAWPAHAMPAMTFFKAVYIWHMVAMLGAAAAAFLLLRRTGRFDSFAWGLTLFAILFATWPVIDAFLTNQPQITVMLLILWAFLLVSRGRDVAGGALLGLAAAIKVAPVLFALIFLANRNWRALGVTLAVAGAIAALSVAVMGWPLHAAFLERLAQINGLVVMTKINFSPEALIYQAVELFRGAPMVDGRENATYIAAEPRWLTWLTKSAFIGLLAAAWAATHRLPQAARLPVQLFSLALITALFGPLSWAHYFVMPALLLPALHIVMPPARAWGWIAAVIVLTSLPAFALLHRFNNLFMVTALVPTLLYLALLADTLRAAWRVQLSGLHPVGDPAQNGRTTLPE